MTLMQRDIKVLHLEPTDVCQAACPLCARETDVDFDPKLHHHLSMDQILQVFDLEKIQKLDKMFMCGNYGDPAAGKHTLDIYLNFRKLNRNIVLGMNTNGGLRTRRWWQRLAKIFNQPRDYVVFSIDGTEHTNHIYRKNVDWNKVMQNAEAFIQAGGKAHWDMLVYQHNQHEVDTCEQLAKQMGFGWFRAKVSNRGETNQLKMPQGWLKPPNATLTDIACRALDEQSLYISAQAKSIPCCWLGSTSQPKEFDFDAIQKTWSTITPYPVCVKACSRVSINKPSRFDHQWQRQTTFS